ncbi:hypothetical protein [Kibdelosporangium aridum]|uniref:hypothetical protein n=1 Tax=Kibdelosporangium aridum TaxID=2030 RepID=UPI000AC3A7E9|nr:hypothetical protein [Kibdelosporangium aridum]
MKSEQVTEELPTQNPHANTNAVTEEYPAQGRHVRKPRPAPVGRPNAVTERKPLPPADERANAGTEEYQSAGQLPEDQPKRRKGRLWRELTGALAAGLTVLALVVLVLQIMSWSNGVPGLGVVELIGHIVAAGLAVYAQRTIDRRPGRPALIAGVGIGVLVVLVLVLFWWI